MSAGEREVGFNEAQTRMKCVMMCDVKSVYFLLYILIFYSTKIKSYKKNHDVVSIISLCHYGLDYHRQPCSHLDRAVYMYHNYCYSGHKKKVSAQNCTFL